MIEILIGLTLVLTGIGLIFFARFNIMRANSLLGEAKGKWNNIKRDIENERREASLKVKDEIYRRRNEFEAEIKRDRIELERLKNNLDAKYETIDKKEQRLDELQREMQQKERNMSRANDILRANEAKIKVLYDDLIVKLESLSGLNREEAKQVLFNTLEAEVRAANQKWIQKVEEDAKLLAKEKSIQIVIDAMQRYTSEQVAPHSSCVIHLPNEDMKGRIIGKEGRNIRALEMATGVEIVIGDTPEIITISGFNSIRREIAKRALEKLIIDGRINPSKIEETVAQCEKELNEMIQEIGRNTITELNMQGVKPELVTLLGKLYFRTSFSQNVLSHSKEVAYLARIIAEELGLNGTIAARAGLLHDVGKAISEEAEGPHAVLGADVARRCEESPIIVNAIAAHHEEVPFASMYAPIILIADTISASRPGARRETLTSYLKRLQQLEEIASSFEGVKKAYALQAGREIRILVEEDFLNDEKSATLARDVVKKVEGEMNFPGQIKVTVIREKRVIEYAR